jgi:hypothetical protein
LAFLALCRIEPVEPRLPILSRLGAARADLAPPGADIVRHHKRRIPPAELLARALDFFGAERRAMRRRGAGLGRRTEGDDRLAGDKARPVMFLRPLDRGGDRGVVVPVDPLGRPAVCGKALDLVVRHRKAGRPVDRD